MKRWLMICSILCAATAWRTILSPAPNKIIRFCSKAAISTQSRTAFCSKPIFCLTRTDLTDRQESLGADRDRGYRRHRQTRLPRSY